MSFFSFFVKLISSSIDNIFCGRNENVSGCLVKGKKYDDNDNDTFNVQCSTCCKVG